MDKAWHVDYKTDDWDHCYIVIHCPTKADVRPILKRHLQGKPHKINRITEWSVDNDRY